MIVKAAINIVRVIMTVKTITGVIRSIIIVIIVVTTTIASTTITISITKVAITVVIIFGVAMSHNTMTKEGHLKAAINFQCD